MEISVRIGDTILHLSAAYLDLRSLLFWQVLAVGGADIVSSVEAV